MLVCFYLLLLLSISEGCTLEGNRVVIPITAYTGGSVLLPCSCTDLRTKPQTFTWRRYTDEKELEEISPESEQYKDRFQLVNDHSPGNLSLLISNLTVEDGRDYRCRLSQSEIRDIRLTVKGCTLNKARVSVTGYVGQSVLLPCSCYELQAKPDTFKWIFFKGSDVKEIFPKDQTNRYTDRVQLVNDPYPGNLSLLVSHLTVQDEGLYRCNIKDFNKDIELAVKKATTRLSSSTATSNQDVRTTTPISVVREEEESSPSDQENTIIMISSGVAAVLLLLLILGGVMYWKRRGQRRGQTEIGDGQTGQRTQKKKQDSTEPLNLAITSEHTYEVTRNENGLYAAVNNQNKHKKAEEKDEVMYSTVVHSNTVRAAPHNPAESADTTVYASIKMN